MIFHNILKHWSTFKGLLVICGLASNIIMAQAQEYSTSLTPKHFTLDNTYNGTEVFCALQYQLFFSFDVPVNVKPDTPAIIICEDDTVAKGSLKNYTIEYSKGKGGCVEAEFDSLLLPKDKYYTIVIEAGNICKQDEPSCTNAEIRRTFHVPDHIKMTCRSPHEGETLHELSKMAINLSAIQDYQSYFKPIIYKEDEIIDYGNLVETYYSLSNYLGIYFHGTPIPLEDGANYTLVIPEGVMKRSRTHYRDDISNEEMRIHIKGGSSTNINTTNTTEKPAIHCDGKTLHIDNTQGQRIRIFALDGRMIHNIICQENSTTLTLPAAGLYIINIGEHTDKISVK